MAASNVREKASKKRKASSSGPKEVLRTGIRILVEDLRYGDRIVTSWHTRAEKAKEDGRSMTVDEVLDVTSYETKFVNRSVEVKEITECPSQWRTHVHVGSGCYDMRTYIWVVKTDDD